MKRLLIANRGEIACRIIRTAKSLGIETVAVYSEADQHALHTRLADRRVCIGTAAAAQSYLNITAIIAAATETQADAIHPGYGFLSENAEFARAVCNAGLIFVGPPADAIELMGDKRAAKQAVEAVGVPLLPGYNGADQSIETLLANAADIGLPLMIKASAGGGGKGMRLATDQHELKDAIASAKREALAAFGNDILLLERALIDPRHVEVQVFADQQGHCVYLGDRDCSLQRRHQKVVEEAPAPGLSDELRQRMGEAAVRAAQACNYVGAGTVEFLLDRDQNFYFLEMNTRLQVEHPVTEKIFGLDLVQWQLAIAQGNPLPLSQAALRPEGHAIEVRLYAEDPLNDFLPQTGEILHWPDDNGQTRDARIDHCLFTGLIIGNHYDPMLGKLIAHGATREQAIERLIQLIEQTPLLGLHHNLGYLRTVLSQPAFKAADLGTGFLSRHAAMLSQSAEKKTALQLAALNFFLQAQPSKDSGTGNWYKNLSTLAFPSHFKLKLHADDAHTTITLVSKDWPKGELLLTDADTEYKIDQIHQYQNHKALLLRCRINGRLYKAWITQQDNGLWLQLNGQSFEIHPSNPLATTHTKTGGLNAPMDGRVVACLVAPDSTVAKGDTLMIIEAMKMEMPIRANASGCVELLCNAGDQIRTGQALAVIHADHTETQSPEEATHAS